MNMYRVTWNTNECTSDGYSVCKSVLQLGKTGLEVYWEITIFILMCVSNKSISQNGLRFITTFIFLLKDSFFFLQLHSTVTIFQNSKTKKTPKLLTCIQYVLAPMLSRLNSNFLKSKQKTIFTKPKHLKLSSICVSGILNNVLEAMHPGYKLKNGAKNCHCT